MSTDSYVEEEQAISDRRLQWQQTSRWRNEVIEAGEIDGIPVASRRSCIQQPMFTLKEDPRNRAGEIIWDVPASWPEPEDDYDLSGPLWEAP